MARGMCCWALSTTQSGFSGYQTISIYPVLLQGQNLHFRTRKALALRVYRVLEPGLYPSSNPA